MIFFFYSTQPNSWPLSLAILLLPILLEAGVPTIVFDALNVAWDMVGSRLIKHLPY